MNAIPQVWEITLPRRYPLQSIRSIGRSAIEPVSKLVVAIAFMSSLALADHFDWIELSAFTPIDDSFLNAESETRVSRIRGSGISEDPNDLGLVAVSGSNAIVHSGRLCPVEYPLDATGVRLLVRQIKTNMMQGQPACRIGYTHSTVLFCKLGCARLDLKESCGASMKEDA